MSDSINDLLDVKLDDLADLPTFKPFSPGAHKVLATFGTKEINGKAAVTLDFTYVELIELADENDEAPKAGDTANTMFMLDNEFGQGNLKKCALPFCAALNLETIREVIEQVKDVECVIISTVRKDKNDPDKMYLSIKEIDVV